MVAPILFVSVKQSFRPWMTLPQLEPWAERAWAISVAKGKKEVSSDHTTVASGTRTSSGGSRSQS